MPILLSKSSMQRDDYSADAICRAVNLSGFIEPTWMEREHPTLRIVLMPSFHPEMCITISRADHGASLSVIVLAEQLWSKGVAAGFATIREEITASVDNFEEWSKLFKVPHASVKEKVLCIDGMSLECCLVSQNCDERFKAHIDQLSDRTFLGSILDFAWNNCKTPKVRNGLSSVAYYLGMKFPPQEIPPEPSVTRIAVLGTPEARQEYLEMLQQAKGRK